MRALFFSAAALALFVAVPASAANKGMFSYYPSNDETRALADSGFTLVFEKGLMGAVRLQKIMATEAPASADLEPADERGLGERLSDVIGRSDANDLYQIDAGADQGAAMIRAFCPGSTKGWLAFGTIKARRNLTVNALGDDPKTGKARLCTTLQFTFRGEWVLPGQGIGQGPPKPSDFPLH